MFLAPWKGKRTVIVLLTFLSFLKSTFCVTLLLTTGTFYFYGDWIAKLGEEGCDRR